MGIFKLIYVLYKVKLLTPLGIYRLMSAMFKYGINLLALLHLASRTYRDKVALVDEEHTITYRDLWIQTERLAMILRHRFYLGKGHKVGIICRNHAHMVKTIFAVSGLGADLYLLNVELSQSQFNGLLEQHDFDLLAYDEELASLIEASTYTNQRFQIHDGYSNDPALVLSLEDQINLQRNSSGRIVILTGGTTGKPKSALHKPSLFNFLNPFITLVTRLNLNQCQSSYIATPIYHGYGVALLILCIALGKKTVILKRFEVDAACTLIRNHQVEFIAVVPLMLHKMLQHNAEALKSLVCIASGGAELNPKLVKETRSKLGDVLYNLYGSSEAGLNIIATPADLSHSAKTIGRAIRGVYIMIKDRNQNEVETGKTGQLYIKNRWSMRNSDQKWIATGDLGYQDQQGYYYLCGRIDDMVVSAGENVYPIEVEQVLIEHPQVDDVAVIGIPDEVFGQRLRAFVALTPHAHITQSELLNWLRPRVARYQMPKDIVYINAMPYTPVGKRDKKRLAKK